LQANHRLADNQPGYQTSPISFFGISEEEIRNCFYEEKSGYGLFGVESEIRKIEKPIFRMAEIYIQRLRTLFPHVTERPLEMKNSKNCPIYHFVFASNNAAAKKSGYCR
jgi:hypothetical protein